MARKDNQTRERLLNSAMQLFSRRWYETVSVAEICRTGNLSNGIFYHYFPNKESIFREILEDFIETLEVNLKYFAGNTISERLREFFKTLSDLGESSASLLTVFREGQYRFPEYEQRLRSLYIRTLSGIYGRTIGIPEYLFITSGVRFLTNRTVQTGRPVLIDQVLDLVEHGAFTVPLGSNSDIFAEPEYTFPETESEDTRTRLITAGIRLFGEKDFYNVNVYEIAREAGFSVGTFYIYFTGKEAFLSALVDLIGRYTRHFITVNLKPGLNRTETEVRGMYLFLKYFSTRRHYYEIVREAEFVVKDTVRRYYDKFAEGYRKNLAETRDFDFYTLSNALIGMSHYLGIETLFTYPGLDSRQVILDLGRYLSRGLKE